MEDQETDEEIKSKIRKLQHIISEKQHIISEAKKKLELIETKRNPWPELRKFHRPQFSGMSKRSRPAPGIYAESDDESESKDDEPSYEPPVAGDESEDLSDDDEEYDDSLRDELMKDIEESIVSLRDQLMKDKTCEYMTFESITREKLLRSLRFVRNFHAHGAGKGFPANNLVHLLARKLLEKYDLTKLEEADNGGIPRAFRCKDLVCTLFACLLVRVIPEKLKSEREKLISSKLPSGLGDPLAEYSETFKNADIEATDDRMCEIIWKEISQEMEELPTERYIKRCVGGAVVYLHRFEHEIGDKFRQYFEKMLGTGSSGKRKFRVLGASTKDKTHDNDRLIIPIYSKVKDQKPTYICAHVPKRLKIKEDLLEMCKDRYEDVKRELDNRTFTLVFSPYKQRFGHWDHTLLRFIAVPENYRLPVVPGGFWDRRGMICAIEVSKADAVEIMNPHNGEVNHFDIVIRRTVEPSRWWKRLSPIYKKLKGAYLERQDGLKMTLHTTSWLSTDPRTHSKDFIIYRPSKSKPNIKQRATKLKDKLKQLAERISKPKWSEQNQEHFHASVEARITLHPIEGGDVTLDTMTIDDLNKK